MSAYPQPENSGRQTEAPGHEHHASQLPATDARQGVMLGHMRYVLGFGLALVVIAFAIIYFFYF
jgi:hypothetical protein